ncbi:hypothetical protein ACFLXY_09705 [Chloroflexota bacterium]
MGKTYIKPLIKRIHLVSEEAVLQGCKTITGPPGIEAVDCDKYTGGTEPDCFAVGS